MILLVNLYFLNKTCNWPTRLTLKDPFASNKPIVTSFGFQSKVKKLMTRANVLNAPLFIHKSDVAIIEVVALTKGKTNSWNVHFIIESNIFSIKVLHDANTTCGSFHKLNCIIHMLSTMFKGSNPFTTNNTKSQWRVETWSREPRAPR